MFTELEKKFIFYVLDSIEDHLGFDEEEKEVYLHGFRLQGNELKEIKSSKDLQKLFDNIMDKCCK